MFVYSMLSLDKYNCSSSDVVTLTIIEHYSRVLTCNGNSTENLAVLNTWHYIKQVLIYFLHHKLYFLRDVQFKVIRKVYSYILRIAKSKEIQ